MGYICKHCAYALGSTYFFEAAAVVAEGAFEFWLGAGFFADY